MPSGCIVPYQTPKTTPRPYLWRVKSAFNHGLEHTQKNQVHDDTLPNQRLRIGMLEPGSPRFKSCIYHLPAEKIEAIKTKPQFSHLSLRKFPGGPVVKTPRCHCRRHGFHLWSRK